MLQHSWYFVTSKFTNFIDLQYGVAKKQDIIHTHIYITRACLLLEVTDVLRSVGMKERSVICASIAVHVRLVSQAQRYFTFTLTMLTLQALCQNYINSSLQTSRFSMILQIIFQ